MSKRDEAVTAVVSLAVEMCVCQADRDDIASAAYLLQVGQASLARELAMKVITLRMGV